MGAAVSALPHGRVQKYADLKAKRHQSHLDAIAVDRAHDEILRNVAEMWRLKRRADGGQHRRHPTILQQEGANSI